MGRVVVFWSNRSEIGLLTPVLHELDRHEIDADLHRLPESTLSAAFRSAVKKIRTDKIKYAICPFDRMQVMMAACACFHYDVPFAQMHGGEISSGTYDDADRHVITLWADMIFTAHEVFTRRATSLRKTAGLSTKRIYTVGISHLDEKEIDESELPNCPYNLVLYNPPTLLGREEIRAELDEVYDLAVHEGKSVVWVGPNGDPGSETIEKYVRGHLKSIKYVSKGYSRAEFLGLLKNADLAIGNSSSFIYEAPLLNTPVKMIGERNRTREHLNFKTGASVKIARLVKLRLGSI
jgi:UDP-N-acetylglucosamine 2-epimerase